VSNDTAILAPETFLMSGNPYNFISGANALISSHVNMSDFGNGSAQKTNVWFVGYPKKTKVVYYGSSPSNLRDFPFIALSASSGVMGCLLERTLLGGEDNFVQTYEYAMFRGNTTAFGGGSSTRAEILNCVLKCSNPAPVLNPNGVQGLNAWSWQYDNDNNKYYALTSSAIYNTGGTWTNSYSGAGGSVSVTKVLASSSFNSDGQQSNSDCEQGITLDTTDWFRSGQSATVIDPNARGVYSGTYSWHLASYPASAFNGNW